MFKLNRRILYLSQLKFEPMLKPKLPNAEQSARTELVRAAIAQLDPVDAKILCGRFGIEALPQTLNALGTEFGMSKQAVAKREHRALTRLKNLLQLVLFDN